ncbi:MAG: ABC transporter permease, partial [Candidatus Poribacteria bacterium]|nr:ABC transporter permease [Candidatus Poribacteria bacterium]
VRLVTQTINDLFFVVSVRNVAVLPGTVIKGVAMGLGATLIAALPSAREAMHAPPRATLSRSVVESGARRSIPRLTVSGAALFTVGVACLLLSHKSLIVSFIGIFALILGCALFVPLATVGAMAVARPVMAGAFGVLGAMATRGVVSTLSRTGVAIAALMIAVSVTVGVGVMTDSFRKTVNRWVGKTLTADIYIAAPIEVRDNTPVGLDPALVERLGKIDGVAQQTTYRGVEIPSPNGFEPLVVAELGDRGYEAFDLLDGDPKAVWGEFQNDDIVFISEPYQHHRGVQRGDFVTMASDRGERSFRVVGVYYDYNAPQGEVMMSRRTYNRYWDDRVVVSTGLIAQDGVAVESILKEARRVAGESSQSVFIRSNEAIRRAGMEIFDRTFAITNVLRLLTTVVAFIGVLSAFMALQLERAREFGVLRANGMTPGQVWQLVVTQTGLMGLSAGLFSLPVGALMGAVMIGVINKRSFGWTLKMVVAPEILGQAVVMAVGAALLAGLYPAWRMARSSPALALREE